jgi:hypothetical protein
MDPLVCRVNYSKNYTQELYDKEYRDFTGDNGRILTAVFSSNGI